MDASDASVEIKLIGNEEDKSTSKSDDIERFDEPWRDRNDLFFNRMRNELLDRSKLHDIISHKNKKLYVYSSIPAIIIPIVMTNFALFLKNNDIILSIGMSVVAIINGLNTLLNFSKKTEIHNTYAGKYAELAGEIDKILIRSKKFREPFDVVLERLSMKKNNLDNNAPYI